MEINILINFPKISNKLHNIESWKAPQRIILNCVIVPHYRCFLNDVFSMYFFFT